MSKQPIVTLLCLVGLLSACSSPTKLSSSSIAKTEDCFTSSTPLPIEISKKQGYYENFRYQIRNIISEKNIVKFQTSKYDFVFCRSNNKWAVKTGTLASELQPPQTAVEYQKELANPRFKTIDFNGKTYQYRVILEPNPFPQKQLAEGERRKEPQKVVFELINPDSKQPQRQTLYTLAQLRQEKIGQSLGVPKVTAALKHDNQLFWSIASEQGEGFNGIGTIISYDPQKNTSIIIQPEAVKRQQITDLVITGNTNNPTFWMGTKISGEGNPDLTGMGLVTYRPEAGNLKSGAVKFYDTNNSPIVGAIPEKLKLDNDKLWVATGNGICQLQWQNPDNIDSWNCQRFAVVTQLPKTGIPLYNSVTSKNQAATLLPNKNGEMQEVLWFTPLDHKTGKGRYEVCYPQGFTATLNEQEITFFSEDIARIYATIQPGKPSFRWSGSEWHWNGDRFVRGLDEVALNSFGGGPRGITDNRANPNRILNSYAIRGDLDLLSLSEKSTSVKYYSGWIDDANIKLYLTTLPQQRLNIAQPNPLDAIVQRLKR
jgi:hypothetical protein